ncbi:MAG: DUF1972 domain-containing protein [Lachnospiraceae bacterium]|nr:DUF1972 domain-containing protein [Lachnospiraceae bacterium]
MNPSNTNGKTENAKRHVFIIGTKGIPAAYGGFETFVDKLTEYRASEEVCYHVACKGEKSGTFRYHGAECFVIPVHSNKPYSAVYYDIAALRSVLAYLRRHREIQNPVVYILACRIGPFIARYAKQIRALGGVLFVNPDGHEWKRAKWSAPVRCYWKISERLMVKHADLLVCDSKNIEAYIRKDYKKFQPKTRYIAYGSETSVSTLQDSDPLFTEWLAENETSAGDYYLVVARFVPENNFETIVREFMRSGSRRKLVIVTTPNDRLYEQMEGRLHFEKDDRICFARPEYNQELLKKIREHAFAYLHGHSVGGTNPSLLEALGLTELNLLYDVGFNKEVAGETALYWGLEEDSLAQLIDAAEQMSAEEIHRLGESAKERVRKMFDWRKISDDYEEIFMQPEKFI